MDESRKQKTLYGVLAVTVALTLAINFWPARSPANEEGPLAVRPVSAGPGESPAEYDVQRDPQEEPVAARPSRRASDEGGPATIRRTRAPQAEKDKVVPSV